MSDAPSSPRESEPQLYRYSIGTLRLDEAKWTASIDGNPVALDPLPFRLLACLLRHRNDVVSKDTMLDEVWKDREKVGDGAIHQLVSRLRKQLGPIVGNYIDSVRGEQGYRLIGDIERKAVGIVPHLSIAFEPGEPVPTRPDFRFDRILGNSRFRTVWQAKSRAGETHVFKFAANADELARLKRERTIYELIKASGVASVGFAELLSFNFEHSPHYIECEYGGEDMLEWDLARGHLAGWPLEQRLGLFLQIANSVAELHNIPAVHGDLKPANILLSPAEGGWQTKLTDFGSGRPLDLNRLRELGVSQLGLTMADAPGGPNPLGTWIYLAPELHHGGRPTQSSDIFALGVLLYQIVVGDLRRAMSTGWEQDLPDNFLVEDITRATQRHVENRFGSVAELILRISTLESRRAEKAAADESTRLAESNAARVRRQAVRRPWVVAAFALLALGLSTSLWFYSSTRAEAQRAQAINQFLLRDVLQAADVTGPGPAQRSSLTLHILDRAAESAGRRFSGIPLTEAEVRYQLGELFYRMSAFEKAQAQYETAAKLSAANTLGVRALYATARALLAQSKLDTAEQRMKTAQSLAMSAGIADEPAIALSRTQTEALNLMMHQRYPESVKVAAHAVQLADEVVPDDLLSRFLARRLLAEVQLRIHDFDGARQTLHAMESPPFSAQSVGEVVFARSEVQRARLAVAQNRFADAERPLLAARAVIVERLGPDEYSLGGIQEELGRVYLDAEKYDLAKSAYLEALRVFTVSRGEDHQQTRVNSLNVAVTAIDAGQPEEALTRLRIERPWFAKNMGGERSSVVQLIDFMIARASLDLGRHQGIAQLLAPLESKALAEAGGNNYPDSLLASERARALYLAGKRSEALAILAQEIPKMRKAGARNGEMVRYESLH